MLRRLQTCFLAENQEDLATGGRTGSSEEEHRRCPGDESSRLRRSTASPPRRAGRGYAAGVPRASAPSLAVHAGDPCSKAVRSARRVFVKGVPLRHGYPPRLPITARELPDPPGG